MAPMVAGPHGLRFRGMNSAVPPAKHIVIAGGGVAALEALLALRRLAGDRVTLTLVSPDPDFTYRPLAVAEPFAFGHANRIALRRFTDDVGAELIRDAVESVDDAAGTVQLRSGAELGFDALLLATGGRQVAGVEGATTWWPGGNADIYGGLLRDIDEGYSKRLAIVVPPGAVWPLPAYELALMTAGEARAMGHDDVEVTVVTPERAPLSLFGERASDAVAEELRLAGVGLRTGVVGQVRPGGLALAPGSGFLDVERIFAVPRLLGPADRRRRERRRRLHRDRARTAAWRAPPASGRPATASSRPSSSAGSPPTRRAAPRPRSPGSPARPTSTTRVSRCCTATCWSAPGRGASRPPATIRARRCGGRPARSRASTCPAGWPSTGSPHGPSRRRRPAARCRSSAR